MGSGTQLGEMFGKTRSMSPSWGMRQGRFREMASMPGFAATFVQRFGVQHGLRNPPMRKSLLRADWEEMAAHFEWLSSGMPQFASRFAQHFTSAFPMANWLSSYVASPAGLHRAAIFAWKRLWPVAFEVEELKNGLVLTCTLEPGERPCEPFFRLVGEVERQLPTIVGAPIARVVAETSGTFGEYLVTFAEHKTAHWRVEYEPEVIFSSFATMGVTLAPRAVPVQWRLTEAESRVVLELVGGASLREVAGTLGIEYETARSHVKRAMAKAGVSRQVELVAAVLGGRAAAGQDAGSPRTRRRES